jgi:triacylglycerol esterase/lipase EstA (alpha/beta hydrolase family)
MYAWTNRVTDLFALQQRSDTPNDSLCILVHGFRGTYLGTWGKLPEVIRTSRKTDILHGWDYCYVGYETWQIATFLDIAERVGQRVTQARAGQAPFDRKYKRFAFAGHSLGTLGIRQLFCAGLLNGQIASSEIKGAVLYGTPIAGSWMAKFSSPLRVKDTLVKGLKLWKAGKTPALPNKFSIAEALKVNSPQIRMLHKWTSCANHGRQWPVIRKAYGTRDAVVHPGLRELVEWAGDDQQQYTVESSHTDMLQFTPAKCTELDAFRTLLT